mmetsp:Transcript_11553/g.32156  ORF Transcript_11553/g.32156 Transcript_11553/m.32156 type:complete len:166 (-) Transcript_11553:60-557(-)
MSTPLLPLTDSASQSVTHTPALVEPLSEKSTTLPLSLLELLPETAILVSSLTSLDQPRLVHTTPANMFTQASWNHFQKPMRSRRCRSLGSCLRSQRPRDMQQFIGQYLRLFLLAVCLQSLTATIFVTTCVLGADASQQEVLFGCDPKPSAEGGKVCQYDKHRCRW